MINILGQNYNSRTLKINDIEKGISNSDYLRAVLLENGFIQYEPSSNPNFSECWKMPIKNGTEIEKKYGKQMIVQLINFDVNIAEKRIIQIDINQDLLPQYLHYLLNAIKSKYVYKTSQKMEFGNKSENLPKYGLKFSTNRNNFEVIVYENNLWTSISFMRSGINPKKSSLHLPNLKSISKQVTKSPSLLK